MSKFMKGNRFLVGNNGGRPAVYETPDEMAIEIEAYFSHCADNHQPMTVTGLALYLGFESKQSLYDYQERNEFSYLIRKARTIVENGYEKALHSNTVTGAIFALKNMGWKDRQDIDVTSGDKPINSVSDDELEAKIAAAQRRLNEHPTD